MAGKITFNKSLVDKARIYFFKVYVDTETPTQYIGSETEYTGHRIRIYFSDWDYETPTTIRKNEELQKLVENFENELKEEYGADWEIYTGASEI